METAGEAQLADNTDKLQQSSDQQLDRDRLKGQSAMGNNGRTRLLIIAALVALYYPMSIGLTFYQKWFLKGYTFPLLVVGYHYMFKFAMATSCRALYTFYTGRQRILLTARESAKRVAPIGIASAIDIGLSNWGLEFITVSLYTMSKSTCIIFILVFAVLLRLEKLRFSQSFVVGLIAIGLVLFTYESQQFDVTGFVLVEFASVCAGVRWAFSQMVMQREEMGLSNPLDLIFHVQPWMIVGIVPLIFIFEGQHIWGTSVLMFAGEIAPFRVFVLATLGGCLAFAMEIAEYCLLVNTSGVTLNVFGIVKEIVVLCLAHYFNGDMYSGINLMGLIVCMSGVTLHVALKAKAAAREIVANGISNSKMGNHNRRTVESRKRLLSSDGSDSNDSSESTLLVTKDDKQQLCSLNQ